MPMNVGGNEPPPISLTPPQAPPQENEVHGKAHGRVTVVTTQDGISTMTISITTGAGVSTTTPTTGGTVEPQQPTGAGSPQVSDGKGDRFLMGTQYQVDVYVNGVKASMAQALAAMEETKMETEFIQAAVQTIIASANDELEAAKDNAAGQEAAGISKIVGAVASSVTFYGASRYGLSSEAAGNMSTTVSSLSTGTGEIIQAQDSVTAAGWTKAQKKLEGFLQIFQREIQSSAQSSDQLFQAGQQQLQSVIQMEQALRTAFQKAV